MVQRLLRGLGMRVRYMRSRLKHSTLRLKTGDLPDLHREFDRSGIQYVVLRWADEVPSTPAQEATHSQDIDHLIANGALDDVLSVSLPRPGSVKCDYYSVGGERGSAYQGMPYYMPEMARGILERRVRHAGGFFVPSPRDAYLSFLYHLVYHKGARCGIETGLGVVTEPSPTRDYAAEVRRLAGQCGLPVPKPFTLVGFHDCLRGHGWNMATDLLPRWPERHPVIDALVEFEKARLAPEIAAARALTVFVLRDDCPAGEAEEIARSMIASRFTILDEIRLDGELRERLMFQTRGGNWTEKGRAEPVGPTLALVCRNAPAPGPLPVAMSASKLKARYPHLENTDTLIKRVIRERIARLEGVPRGATVIHATDNPLETAETLRALYGDGTGPHLARFTGGDQAPSASPVDRSRDRAPDFRPTLPS